MTLPSSGPMSLDMIQGEFGGANPISINEYYAGGGLVPPGTVGVNGPVPSSGLISFSHFYGTSKAIDIQSVTIGHYPSKDTSIDGFYAPYGVGTISDGTFNPKGGAVIYGLYYDTAGPYMALGLNGTYSNDGWTTMTISGSVFTRASASFIASGGITTWYMPGPNVFAGSGTLQAIFL